MRFYGIIPHFRFFSSIFFRSYFLSSIVIIVIPKLIINLNCQKNLVKNLAVPIARIPCLARYSRERKLSMVRVLDVNREELNWSVFIVHRRVSFCRLKSLRKGNFGYKS